MSERLKIPEIPKTYEDAIKVAKSLVSWLEFLKENKLKVNDPYGSFGGHVDFHLATLNVWNVEMKIKSSAEALKSSVGSLKEAIENE
jgi:hypothetical protein